jgi:hypothetical protein
MNKFLNLAVYIAAFVLVLASCKDEEKPKDFSLDKTSLTMVVGDEEQITASPVIETYTWESMAPTVATVSTSGLVKAVGAGSATIKVTCGKTVKEVPVTVAALVPITEIQVSKTSLDLHLGDAKVLITTTLLPASNNAKDKTLEWKSSAETVVKVSASGEIEIIGVGEATVTVSLKSNSAVKKEIAVKVSYAPVVVDFSTFEDYEDWESYWDWGPVPINCVYAQVSFYEGGEIEIPELSDAVIAKVYNRDFMNYDAAAKKLTFTGKSGEWDVFYSEKYEYIWVVKLDAGAPDFWWLAGAGVWTAPTFNFEDMATCSGHMSEIRQAACMKPIADGKYQTHVYLSLGGIWGVLNFSIFAERRGESDWAPMPEGQIGDVALTGETTGFKKELNDDGEVSIKYVDDVFVPGYYRLIYNINDNTLNFKRISD